MIKQLIKNLCEAILFNFKPILGPFNESHSCLVPPRIVYARKYTLDKSCLFRAAANLNIINGAGHISGFTNFK